VPPEAATLCMAQDMDDLKLRLGNIFIGFTYSDKPVFARDLKEQGTNSIIVTKTGLSLSDYVVTEAGFTRM
jgi:formate--tetrahydrofolate ligase